MEDLTMVSPRIKENLKKPWTEEPQVLAGAPQKEDTSSLSDKYSDKTRECDYGRSVDSSRFYSSCDGTHGRSNNDIRQPPRGAKYEEDSADDEHLVRPTLDRGTRVGIHVYPQDGTVKPR